MRTVTNGGRTRGRARREARALLAAADGLDVTYEVTQGGPADRVFWQQAVAGGHVGIYRAEWPCEETITDDGEVLARDDSGIVYRLDDGSLVSLHVSHGWLYATVAVAERARADELVQGFSVKYPPLFRELPGDDATIVPVTFWTNSKYGPTSRMRMIESAEWEPIAANYTADVRAALDGMVDGTFQPGKSGQLILWQGPPGTGKTWALRALAAAWRPWCEFHVITDPDSFFVDDPSYMIDVLLANTYDELVVMEADEDAEVLTSIRDEGKWRVLVLEDTGELLSATSKEKYGQGLSRVLNVVDGMVGQGLRVMLLVTTNDELGDLHPAVKRPGRCAQALTFGPLTEDEATTWLNDRGLDDQVAEGPMTVAELYHLIGQQPTEVLAAGGLVEIPGAPGWYVRQADLDNAVRLATESVEDEIHRVAAAHQPGEPAYGLTYWNAETRTVFWVDWDGTSLEEHDAAFAAFLAIPGVDKVDGCAECAAPSGEAWQQIYPVDGERLNHADEALRAVLSEASAPLTETLAGPVAAPEAPGDVAARPSPLEGDLVAALRSLESDGQAAEGEALGAALTAVAAAHAASMETIRAVLVSSAERRGEAIRPDVLTMAALGVLEKMVTAPPAPAPVTHVHVPSQDLSVHVDAPIVQAPPPADVHVHVDVPEQPAPVVHVAAAAAPDVHVAAAEVRVELPEQPAPVVNVHVPPATAPEPRAPSRARIVRSSLDAAGQRIFTIEEPAETTE